MLKSDFENHAIWAQIEAAEAVIDNALEDHPTDERARAQKKQIEYVRWVLEQSDCALISSQQLEEARGNFAEISRYANNLAQYSRVDHYFSQFFNLFPYPRIKKIFKSETNRVIDGFAEAVSDLKAETSSISSEVKNTREEVETLVQQTNNQLQELASKASSYEKAIDQAKSDFETSINTQIAEKMSEFTERFSKAQSERSEKSQEALDNISKSLRETEEMRQKLNAEYEKSIQESFKTLEAKRDEFEAQAKETLTKLDGFYDKAGQDALAADFAGNAEKEDKSFKENKTYAVWAFSLSAIVLGIMWFQLAVMTDFQFAELLQRVPVSVVFLLPGFYFASLASGHRKSALKLRSLGLRIKSFGAYVTPADKDEQVQLRAEMVKEFFAEEKEIQKKNGLFDRSANKTDERVVGLMEKVLDKIPKP